MAVHVARPSPDPGHALMSWLPDAYPDLRRFAGAVSPIADDPDEEAHIVGRGVGHSWIRQA